MQYRDILNYSANRQPSLHEYSILAMKVRLVDDEYAIRFPIACCSPLNADYDGDSIAVHKISEDAKEDTLAKMSPRYMNIYKKNNQPIYQFNLETLNGLSVLSEYVVKDPDDLKNPKHYYDDYTELLKDVEVNKKIKMNTPITFTGKVGELEYKNQTTTYGRLRMSKILNAEIEKIGILEDPYARIDAKAATKLARYLTGFDDGVEKRQQLQKLALRAVTQAGVVTFDYKTLFTNTNTETYKKICDIADSKELTDQQKLVLLTERYAQYEKEIEKQYSDDLKKEISRAGKVKVSSISAMNMPQFIVSGIDEKPIITRGSLLGGYTEKDMIVHSVENRSLQSIKQSAVQMIQLVPTINHRALLE